MLLPPCSRVHASPAKSQAPTGYVPQMADVGQIRVPVPSAGCPAIRLSSKRDSRGPGTVPNRAEPTPDVPRGPRASLRDICPMDASLALTNTRTAVFGSSDAHGVGDSGSCGPRERSATFHHPDKETDMVNTDQPYSDTTAYGNGPNDSVSDSTENAAITHGAVALAGRQIAYTATAGHLVTVDPSSSKPVAKIFYVAFTEDNPNTTDRPVTFFYNGGPGSSSVWLLLGSFAPLRLKTAMPSFTPPAPYTLGPKPDSLLDRSDLVFINPVGTGYSAAIAPNVNKDFWGVDQDAASLRQFIKRYLTRYDR